MLETRLPPSAPRTRRPGDSAPVQAPRPPRTLGSAALAPERAPQPAPASGRRADRAALGRLARSEMRLMGVATVCTALFCGLLLLYLAAYAQVTRLGIAQASARTTLRQNRLQNEMLRAERDRLQSPAAVIARASALGMTPRGRVRVDYIRAGQDAAGRDAAGQGAAGRGGSGGTTVGDTSFGH